MKKSNRTVRKMRSAWTGFAAACLAAALTMSALVSCAPQESRPVVTSDDLTPPSAAQEAIAQEAGVELVDYFARPELTVYNAIPTAEGCIGILLAERTRTLWGTNLLLLGFGPVGQALGARLAALGANVTVCARRAEQRALAESLGLRGAELARLAALAPAFDTVVNTIPAPVLTEPVLAALRPGSLIVDLASKPGGTDFAAAQRLGCKAIHALSLPAACAPDTAGEAVARTVLTILREREEHT